MTIIITFLLLLTIIADLHGFFFLLKSKDQASVCIQKNFKLIKTQFGKTIKCFRSDNAKEFLLTEFLANEGTLHQFSYPYTPEQNSVAERKHQHLLNIARSIMFQSKVPLEFWGDCILPATYIINRIPTSILQK